MKNKLSAILEAALLCAAILLTCTGCKGTNTYAAKVVTNEAFADDDVEGAVATGITTITIGDSTYNVKWSKSVRYKPTDELYDYYEVIDSEDNFLPGTIRLDPKTGEVISFSNVEPYPAIENMDTLSDDELKAAAEQLLGDLADFSRYNFFEVTRPLGIIGTNTDTTLRWQVKRDILCNISVDITIKEDGTIKSFSKTNACLDGTAESYIPKDERIKLLEAEICHYLGVKSIDNVNYEICSEQLSMSHNESCIFYMVEITDEAGFSELVLFSVFKR